MPGMCVLSVSTFKLSLAQNLQSTVSQQSVTDSSNKSIPFYKIGPFTNNLTPYLILVLANSTKFLITSLQFIDINLGNLQLA